MQEIKEKIAALEAKEKRSPMQQAILIKLKKDLEAESLRNGLEKEGKSMFFPKAGEAKMENIAIEAIEPNPYQPRRHFRETEIEDLAAAIKSKGLIEPIVVTKTNGKTTLIAGQKRLKAYIFLNEQEKKEGLEPLEMSYFSIPCFLVETKSETDIAILSIAENTARENPFILDTAIAIKTLFELLKAENPGLSQNKYSEQAKEYFGIKSKGTISKYLQIASLDKAVQDEVFKKGLDSFTELYSLAKSTLSAKEQLEAVKNGSLSEVTSRREAEATNKEPQEDQAKTEKKEESLDAGEPGAASQKKPKTKIDIRYLIDTIENLMLTPEEDKPRLKEELVEYLLEFEG